MVVELVFSNQILNGARCADLVIMQASSQQCCLPYQGATPRLGDFNATAVSRVFICAIHVYLFVPRCRRPQTLT